MLLARPTAASGQECRWRTHPKRCCQATRPRFRGWPCPATTRPLGDEINRDPLGEPDFYLPRRRHSTRGTNDDGKTLVNLYGFVSNTPTKHTDAFGLEGIDPGGILVPPMDETPAGCAKIIARQVGREYCNGPKQAPDDRDCREAHCIASCRIKRECPMGAATAFAAGWQREIAHWHPDSPGDLAANKKGRDAASGDCPCEEACKGVR